MIFNREPHLGHGNHDYSPLPADPNHLAHTCVEVLDVLKNFKGSYQWKELTWKLNLRRGHEQDLEVRFIPNMRPEVFQSRRLYIYAHRLIKARRDKLSNAPVPAPNVQISSAFRTGLDRIDPAERKVRKFLGGSRSMARCSAAKHWGVLNLHLSRQSPLGRLGGHSIGPGCVQ